MILLFLEFLGTTEVLVILVVALLLFGPRKLPELSRSFGKSLAEFKRASEEFKQTWEKEVAMEEVEKGVSIERAMIPEDPPMIGAPVGRGHVMRKLDAGNSATNDNNIAASDELVSVPAPSIKAIDSSNKDFAGEAAESSHTSTTTSPSSALDAPPVEPMSKRDWL
jgi:TatA/E family protein of Tat protein translocase